MSHVDGTDDVVEFIEKVVRLDKNVRYACLHGSCYNLYEVVKCVFETAEPYINGQRDHVAIRVGNILYDANGRIGSIVGKAGDKYHKMDATEKRVAAKWSR